ncbi:MAG: hypothetical protein ABMA15_07700 [Vicinamibacterales bacterium]
MLTRLLRRLGRLLEPLLAPDAEARRVREGRLLDQVRELRGGLRELTEQAAAQRAELKRTQDVRAADAAETQARLADLRGGVRRQAATLGRLARRAGIEAGLELTEQRVLDRLDRLRRSGRPIIIGPWTGEIGFELLYWIPFVRWAVEKYDLPADRLIVVSRGGARGWYVGLGSRDIDVFSVASPDEFRARTEAVKKQRFMGAFDRELVRRVRLTLGGEGADLLHPALMYALFMPFWKQQAALPRVTDHARYRRIEPGTPPAGLPPLPSEYVAVRFYFSDCFPDTPQNREFVSSVVAALAEQSDVVMLNPGFRVDDHVDYTEAARSRIHTIDMSGHAAENLAWQTSIIARAKALVGTYGGFAYLAPFCGVDAVAFYSERTYFVYHLELAQRAFADVRGGTLEAIHLGNTALLRTALSGLGAASRR